jgi:hypothetical protein
VTVLSVAAFHLGYEKGEIMFVQGNNGQVEFDGNSLLITRKGLSAFLSQGMKGEKRIPVGNVTSVQFKSANMLTNGFIQFATASSESRGGMFDATKDENSVMFAKNMQADFEKLRTAVEDAMEAHSKAKGGQVAAESPLDALKKLKELLDLGVITQAEFDAKKENIMGKF